MVKTTYGLRFSLGDYSLLLLSKPYRTNRWRFNSNRVLELITQHYYTTAVLETPFAIVVKSHKGPIL